MLVRDRFLVDRDLHVSHYEIASNTVRA